MSPYTLPESRDIVQKFVHLVIIFVKFGVTTLYYDTV